MTIDSKGVFIPGSPWSPIDAIQQDIFFKNKNRLILIVGDPRTGKSLTACRIGELVNPARFTAENLDKFIALGSSRKFMQICNSEYVQEGDVVLFDEAGIGISSRTWFSEFNKAVNFVIQIFGYKRLCVIFTVPRSKMIDSQVRSIFSDIIETHGIDHQTCQNSLRWMKVITDNIYQKTLYHYFRHEGRVYTKIHSGLPTKAILEAYLALEKRDKPKVMEKLSASLNAALVKETSANTSMATVMEATKSVTANYARYVTYDQSGKISGVDIEKLNSDFNLAPAELEKVKLALEKGITNMGDQQ